MADLVANLKDVADTVTRTVVAVFTLVAVVVVVVGLWRAVRDRRREQLVIVDLPQVTGRVTTQEVDATGLSPLLRQRVLRRLASEQQDADWIVDLLRTDARQGRLPLRMELEAASQTVSAAASDTLATFSKGLKAVAPKEADGLIGALSSALPPPRGYLVRTYPLSRGPTGDVRLGLALELSRLEGPPIATTTLWVPTPDPPDPAAHREPAPSYQERLIELLEVATRWIAVRLIAERLTTSPVWGLHRRAAWIGVKSRQQRLGMRRLFAGALALTAMKECREHALAFGAEASDDLQAAAGFLGNYHRPWVTLGGVQEQMGFASQRAGAADYARQHFASAALSWQQARDLLAANPGRPARGNRPYDPDDELERLRIRRLKCLLLTEDETAQGQVIEELSRRPLTADHEPRTLFSAACLCAHAAGHLGPEYLGTAWRMLGRALLAVDDDLIWAQALTDDELAPLGDRRGFVDHLRRHRPPGSAVIGGQHAERVIDKALGTLPAPAER